MGKNSLASQSRDRTRISSAVDASSRLSTRLSACSRSSRDWCVKYKATALPCSKDTIAFACLLVCSAVVN
jgi:hypothetical protein